MLKYIHIFNIILEGPVVGHLEIERRMSVAYIILPLNDGMTERRKLRAFFRPEFNPLYYKLFPFKGAVSRGFCCFRSILC